MAHYKYVTSLIGYALEVSLRVIHRRINEKVEEGINDNQYAFRN